MMTRKFLMIALGISSLSLAACDVHSSAYFYDDHPRPRRDVIVEQPAPPYGGPVVVQQPAYVEPAPIIVQEEPPPVPVERIVASPGEGYFWVAGHYDRAGDRWVLRPGHWERPPHPGAVWVPPRSERRSDGIHVSLGFWR